MPIHSFRPLTPSGRFTSLNMEKGLSKKRPQRALTESKHKTGGRNVYGRVTSRHRGGGHKQLYRIVDFKRNLLDLPARVQAIEYDPNRSANTPSRFPATPTSIRSRKRSSRPSRSPSAV